MTHFGGHTFPDNPGPGDVYHEIGAGGARRLTTGGLSTGRIEPACGSSIQTYIISV